jgi:hypothetical protein
MIKSRALAVVVVLMVGCAPTEEEPAPQTTAIGEPIAGMTATSATIGATGGTVTSSDGRVTVNFPAGALSADATISVQPISNLAHGGIGLAYRMTGAETFQQPVSLVFTFTDEDLAGTAPEFLDVAFQNPEGFWQLVDSVTVDAEAKTITATTTHFTDYSFVAKFRIIPSAARVKVDEGKQFHIERTHPLVAGSGKKLPTLLFGWSPIGVTHAARVVSEWGVNGSAGGNSTVGTIYADIDRGGYGAPSKKPTPATVTVSARVTNPLNTAQTGLLKVPVTVVDDDKAIIQVRARYSRTNQLLTAFVEGNVTDNGFDTNMSFPVVDETLVIADHLGGTAEGLHDTRPTCLMPALIGSWDQLTPTSAEITGSFLTVTGTMNIPPITLGNGEGNCSVDRRTEDAKTQPGGVQLQLPFELLDSSPPAEPIVATQDGWTFTFRTLP